MTSKVYAPEGFALDIFKKRYTIHENETWEEACERVATHVANAEVGDNRLKYKQEFEELLKNNYLMPGGRIFYGSGRAKGQLLNCFVVPTNDSREGWAKTVGDMIVISGTGGGVGINCSPIRPRGTKISGTGGVATGAVSLMEIINAAGEVIKAGGGRRTALMLALSIEHGDVEEFLDKKLDLNQLNNANVSVVFDMNPEDFFEKVKKNKNIKITFRNETSKEVSAKQLWNKIIKNALKNGEPGMLNFYNGNKMSNIWYYKPLICSNPCITGDTLIATADGRNAVSIKQLCEEGKDVPVYSTDVKTGQVQIKTGRNPRVTGIKKEVWKLILDDGSILRATPNHKILTKQLEYVELKDLKEGMSIFPFNSFNSNGYRQVANVGQKMKGGRFRNRRQYRLIAEQYFKNVDPKVFAIHHKDFNSFNDCVENLEVITHEKHKKIHAEKMIGDKNPYHKMSDEWKFKFASHPGSKNPKYIDVSNEEIIEHGKKLFAKQGKLTISSWVKYAKENKLPQFLANKARFGTFDNFKSNVISNHKVVSVEFDCFEDVYNITVDDNHNYHVVTSTQDKDFINSSGICIKNCGEILLEEYGCCCLGALVLPRFIKDNGNIDWKLLEESVGKSVRFLDNVLTVNNYPLPEIADNCNDVRRIGLGIMGLHDMLLTLGMKYNSPEGLEFVDKLMNKIKNFAYEASCDLAKEKGSFPKLDKEKFLKSNFVKTLKPTIRAKIKDTGIRNCALLTIAPTGTTSMVCNVTSGIEPMFAPAYERRWFNGDKREMEIVVHPLFKKYFLEGKDYKHFQGTYDLSMRDHFEMQRTCQKHIDNAVSKTINVPPGTSEDELSDLYMEYFVDLKGVTVYPEGSRENQPLTPISLKDAVKYLKDAEVSSYANDSCKNGSCDI